MINKYPLFSKLDLSHRDEIKAITSKFDPYSDFNFTSLFSWNTDNQTEVSNLNGNLVIKMADYITGEPVISILGDNKIDESLDELLKYSKELKLIPDVVVKNIQDVSKFNAIEDRDNFDYIYSTDEHSDLPGGKFKGRRNKISRFKQNYPNHLISDINFKETGKLENLNKLFYKWAIERDRSHEEISLESKAINNFLSNHRDLNLINLEMSVDGELLGFSINEIIHGGYAVSHFQKVLTNFNDIDALLTQHTAQKLRENGSKYINWEQDLGVPGLRQFKESYKPIKYLKKYKVTKN